MFDTLTDIATGRIFTPISIDEGGREVLAQVVTGTAGDASTGDHCGGWGGSVTGISNIDGIDASNNSTGTYQRYEDDKWYKIRLRVTPENLSVWINDNQIVDYDIKDRKISLRPGPIESYAPLALSTYNTTAAIKNVRLKAVK